MISINIQGGLGNQLFMICASLAYGIQHNVKVVFPYHKGVENRGTYWDTLFNNLQMFTTEYPENNSIHIDSFRLYKETNFTYDPLPDFGDTNICLFGYFQSPLYFENCQSIIYELIRLSDKKSEIRNKYHSLFDKKSLSMHFRMGDYKQKRYYHPIMNYEYFEGALTYIMENTTVERVLYLCEQEDNEYVGKQINLLKNKYPTLEFIKVDDSLPDYEQLLIMTCCDHNIMSNSTFSWWGAYMNENSEKIVCYPSVWFGEYYEHTHNFKDMMNTNWKKIDAKPIPWNESL